MISDAVYEGVGVEVEPFFEELWLGYHVECEIICGGEFLGECVAVGVVGTACYE